MKALNEFVQACKKKFGKNLVSIVLFGSRVKGYASKYSDYDVLIIVKDLPDIKERFDLVAKLESKIYSKHKIKISSILVEPEEIFTPINPLLFGVLTGYKILLGKRNFVNNLNKAKSWIEKFDPIYVEGGKEWRVKELV
ncbi:MAG: nucleotidyltransferase domain-containing protein [Candidatus Aenigmarchaeota archaeon]|nr:nucleotidyltransferase domain-containing protein [Candidatus Aenigmarchaeota archaeon]MCX8179467.1 nucleotidyltransferase domain-containing protein [Candidatus Aenigmarchaeota archaeon]